jgi:hypothetical protein
MTRAMTSAAPAAASVSTYYVVPHRGRWAVRRTGARRPTGVFPAKRDAVSRARDLARASNADVIVHNADGRVANLRSLLQYLDRAR